jgi:transaldolase
MKLFLDSALTDEIASAIEHWGIDGVTTNPRHVATAGKPFLATLREIAGVVQGTELPVSVEVNPHLTGCREMVDEGLRLAEISPNFVIKVGAGESGFEAVRRLTEQGIRTNLTLVFSVAQAWHAARCGAAFISPFIGWKEAHGDDGLQLVADVAQMLTLHDYPSEIIAAAVRNSEHIAAAALAGAHCVTAGAAVYRDSFRNPYTDMGTKIFSDAWDATPRE